MKHKLTTSFIDKLESESAPYFVYDTEMRGLSIRVEPTGTKTYYFRYRNEEGKRSTLKLGAHGVLKPPMARERANKTLVEVAQGHDPATTRKKMKSGTDTLGGYIARIYSPWVTTHQKSGKATVGRINSGFDDLLVVRLVELSPFLFEKWRKIKLDAGSNVSFPLSETYHK